MADLVDHVRQAAHNEACAKFLLHDKPEYRDWAITAAFYSAVHLVEACFSTMQEIGHTETADDRADDEGKHQFRERKVRELARGAHKSYRKLREASYNVRYIPKVAAGGGQVALDYYDEQAARLFIERDLSTIRMELQSAFGIRLD